MIALCFLTKHSMYHSMQIHYYICHGIIIMDASLKKMLITTRSPTGFGDGTIPVFDLYK